MLRLLSMLLALPAGYAGHCYSNMAVCQTCVDDARGSPCAFCGSVCQMASDACSAGAITTEANCPGYTPPDPLPGEPFFQDVSNLLATNPAQLNYGVAVTDTNGNGKLEFVVAGFGAANQAPGAACHDTPPVLHRGSRYAMRDVPGLRVGRGERQLPRRCYRDAAGCGQQGHWRGCVRH